MIHYFVGRLCIEFQASNLLALSRQNEKAFNVFNWKWRALFEHRILIYFFYTVFHASYFSNRFFFFYGLHTKKMSVGMILTQKEKGKKVEEKICRRYSLCILYVCVCVCFDYCAINFNAHSTFLFLFFHRNSHPHTASSSAMYESIHTLSRQRCKCANTYWRSWRDNGDRAHHVRIDVSCEKKNIVKIMIRLLLSVIIIWREKEFRLFLCRQHRNESVYTGSGSGINRANLFCFVFCDR